MRLALFSMPTHPPGRPVHESYADDFATFELADRLGFAEAWIGEHFTSVWENIPDPLAFIAEAAYRTARMRFGTGVLLMPFHNPLYAALRIAQLDQQTRGRIQIGIGSGGLGADRAIFGIDKFTPDEASRMTREGIELLLRCWAGEPFEFSGEFFKLNAPPANSEILSGVLMRPFQQPHPPIAIAGNTRGSWAIENAGRRGWMPMSAQFLHANALATHKDAYVAGATAAGRVPDLGLWRISRDIYVAETTEQARREARSGGIARTYTDYFFHIFTQAGTRAWDWFKSDPALPDAAITIDYMMDNTWIVGSPDDVAAQVRALYQQVGGFGYLMAVCHDWWPDQAKAWRSMELLATRVLPQLADLQLPGPPGERSTR
jgi:alkanesulfonate monooxygenase SsuD/methylene tetrahydromethanopterin reductase-like flavin-dependent oxidoreductase (luciferase family)